jgi:hypothetical protein
MNAGHCLTRKILHLNNGKGRVERGCSFMFFGASFLRILFGKSYTQTNELGMLMLNKTCLLNNKNEGVSLEAKSRSFSTH